MKNKICIVGLGYVRIPFAHAFSKKYEVVGFDINTQRISELNNGFDRIGELDNVQINQAIQNGMQFTFNLEDINDYNIYIVTIPTPIDKDKKPDLTPLIKSSQTVGEVLSKGDIVIYESIVYPGVTEDVCIPELERVSELKEYGCKVDISDYWTDKNEYDIDMVEDCNFDDYQAVVLAVGHDKYKNLEIFNQDKVIFDIKSPSKTSDGRL